MRKYTPSNPISNEYEKYLITRCGLRLNAAKTSKSDLNRVSECMKSLGIVEESIYEIKNIKLLRRAMIKLTESDTYKSLPAIPGNKNYKSRWRNTMEHYSDFAAQNRKFSHKCV